ncbi:MAG TPA: glycosyltransferase [Solirubrobacteraceae bacterium]|nr:glycosyltransferase [Solirubrobacteraceae bacterium]
MRIVAIIQTYNEQRFIGGCLAHLEQQGILAYLVDNESSDETVAIAERHLAGNLVGIESLPRDGNYSQRRQLTRKEELARSLEADWFIHLDADERRVASERGRTLAQALAEADEAGFNAVNFLEFTFVPTREAPDHDHPDYERTMRSYYPFLPRFPHRLNAWKRQDGPVALTPSGGHVIRFPGLRMAPQSLYSRHYLFLNSEHAARKFGPGRYAPEEVEQGWHEWRAKMDAALIELPSERELRHYEADHLLDPSRPRKQHIAEQWAPQDSLVKRLKRAARRRRRKLPRASEAGSSA